MRSLKDGAPLGVVRFVLLGRARRPRLYVMTIRFAAVGGCRKDMVGVKPLCAARMLLVARPLNAGATTQLRVGHPAIIAEPTLRAFLPMLERPLCVHPFDQRLSSLSRKSMRAA